MRSSSASRSIVAAHWWFHPAIMNQDMAWNHHHNGVMAVDGQQYWQARFAEKL